MSRADSLQCLFPQNSPMFTNAEHLLLIHVFHQDPRLFLANEN